MTRYDSLDAWRGVACLSVLIFHVVGYRWPGWDLLWGGVPMFFVISGYCIAASTARHVQQGLGWRGFMRRRLRRIYPPYVAFLTLAILLTVIAGYLPALEHALFTPRHGLGGIPRPEMMSVGSWFGSLTLTEGWRHLLTSASRPQWFMEHAWSLGYEEQFYALMALLLAVCGRSWTMGVIGITVATVLLMFQIPARGLFLDGRWLSFACGVGVFVHVHRYTPAWMMPSLIGGYAGLLALSGAVFVSRRQMLGGELFAAAGFALVLLALHRFDAQITRRTSALTWCGVRCYSIYLLHWPITQTVDGLLLPIMGSTAVEAIAAVVMAGAVTLSAAAVFFRWVEQPCLSRPRPQAESQPAYTGA